MAGESPRRPLPDGNARLVRWLRRFHTRIRTMVSICTGAFLLAEAGVLDGRRATTHWLHLDELRSRFPATRVVDEGSEETPLPLKAITARTGLGDASTMWRVFTQRLGVTPAEYRQRFVPVPSHPTRIPADESRPRGEGIHNDRRARPRLRTRIPCN